MERFQILQIGNRKDYRLFLSSLDPIADWPANMIANTFDFSHFTKLVDVGGGTGIYSQAIIKKHPKVKRSDQALNAFVRKSWIKLIGAHTSYMSSLIDFQRANHLKSAASYALKEVRSINSSNLLYI